MSPGKKPASRLELFTLGEFQIRLDGRPLRRLASRKADGLLAYLAVTRRSHAREHLATLLWDDLPLRRSLGNLSVLLNSLRKQLETFLDIDRQAVSMDQEARLTVDVAELEQGLRAVRGLTKEGARPDRTTLEAASRALDVYRGEFLQGFHLRGARGFEEWVTLERERLGRDALEGLRQLADGFERAGDVESAAATLHRALLIDPLQEDLHRSRMRTLALCGRMGEALAQYRLCAETLRTELGVEPAQATRDLYGRLLERRERPAHNLPALASQTIGREVETEDIVGAVRRADTRLLTLVGAGGIGKTRLALEAAYRLSDSFLEGVWFVDLADVDDPQRVSQVVGHALAMPESQRGPAEPDELERLVTFLRSRDLLLVMDNCEHLVEACRQITDRLLRGCPRLSVLATGRRRLDLSQEKVIEVQPLPVPALPDEADAGIERLAANESILLFLDRARAVRAPFELDAGNARTLTQICKSLDGMPLAIELAASRLRSHSLDQIADNLEQRMVSLGHEAGGVLPRHQTLAEAIQWSYDLLDPDEQRVFRLTAIFRGGFDLEALVEVARALPLGPRETEHALTLLVEQSLVILRPQSGVRERYTLLEPVRQFGLEKMKEDPSFGPSLERFAAHFLALSETLAPELHGRRRKSHVDTLEREADNLRATLRILVEGRRGNDCLRLNHALWEGFWHKQGYFSEGRRWVESVLAVSDDRSSFLYGSTLIARGAYEWTLGNLDASIASLDQALAFAEGLGDLRLLQQALYWKAIVVFDHSDFSEAEGLLRRGHQVARQAGERRGAAWDTFYLGQIARVRGQLELAVRLYTEALSVMEDEDVFGAGWSHTYLGHLAIERGDLARARWHLEQSRRIHTELGNLRGLGGTERGLGLADLEAGDLEAAEDHLQRSRHLFERLGWIKMSSSSMIYLGHIATQSGRVEEAAGLLIGSLAYQQREHDLHSIAHLLLELGLLADRRGVPEAAACLFEAAESLQRDLGVTFPKHLVLAVRGCRASWGPERRTIKGSVLPWQECVDLILLGRPTWLAAMQQAL
jgi:predicted ATPase/DNA-binding SARP family transcriptional activator